MKIMADEMERQGINFLWFVFTNDTAAIPNKNVIYMKPTLNIRPYIAMVKGKGYRRSGLNLRTEIVISQKSARHYLFQ